MALTSCAASYDISGTSNVSTLDGRMLYLQILKDNEFKKIDSKNPYDNGLTFRDISKIEFETSRKGNAIQLRFVREACGQPYRIIGFASIENKNNSMRIGEGWRMTPPLIIG